MQSLKAETDQLNQVIRNFEDETAAQVARAEQADLDIRDFGKKCSKLEFDFDEKSSFILFQVPVIPIWWSTASSSAATVCV